MIHCNGRTHVYAPCCALVVDKLVCFHRTEANCHRPILTDERLCSSLSKPDAPTTTVRDDKLAVSIVGFGLANGSQARGCWRAACDSTIAAELMHATLPGAESTVTGHFDLTEGWRALKECRVKCESVSDLIPRNQAGYQPHDRCLR